MSDWIKIHRSVLDSYCFANPNSFKVWVWMLLKANYKSSFVSLKIGKGNTTIKIERGQFIFGRNKAEQELEIDGSTVYRILQKFEELKQIIIEPNSQYSVITICNYNIYQNIKEKDEQPMNNQRTAGEQPTNSERTTNEHIKEELESKEYKESKEQTNSVFEQETKSTLCPKMLAVFKKYIPTYRDDATRDYEPLLNIGKFIFEQGKINGNIFNHVDEVCEVWEISCQWISKDSFYSQKTLKTISTYYQEIINKTQHGTNKSVTNGSSKGAGTEQLLASIKKDLHARGK